MAGVKRRSKKEKEIKICIKAMGKIISILFKYLRGEAHYQFLNLFNLLLIEFSAVKNLVSVFYDEFADLLAQEKRIVDAQKSSDYTQQIADADHRRDLYLTNQAATDFAYTYSNISDAAYGFALATARYQTYGITIVAGAEGIWCANIANRVSYYNGSNGVIIRYYAGIPFVYTR
jgi:hypothetical protein